MESKDSIDDDTLNFGKTSWRSKRVKDNKRKISKRKYTKEVRFAVIEEVKLEGIIWDTAKNRYAKKEEVREAYGRVVQNLKLRDILVSIEEAQSIFHNLRTQYHAERRKEASPLYTSKWEFLDSLTFLDDKVRWRRSKSTLHSPLSTPPNAAVTRREADRVGNSMENSLQTSESISKSAESSQKIIPKKSSDTVFGEFVATQLAEIKDKGIKNQLQTDICSSIFAAKQRDLDGGKG